MRQEGEEERKGEEMERITDLSMKTKSVSVPVIE
jgi:hypothetical protein